VRFFANRVASTNRCADGLGFAVGDGPGCVWGNSERYSEPDTHAVTIFAADNRFASDPAADADADSCANTSAVECRRPH